MNDLAIGGDHEAAFEKYLKEGQDVGQVDVDKIEFNVQVSPATFLGGACGVKSGAVSGRVGRVDSPVFVVLTLESAWLTFSSNFRGRERLAASRWTNAWGR